ncbi:MAG: hypothetical protein AAF725_25890 [Acidobacteriota bacterium]
MRAERRSRPVRTGEFMRDLEVAGDFIYATDGEQLHVMDISDPGQLDLIRSLDLPGAIGSFAFEVDVEGSLLFVSGGFMSGLRIFDLADPASPVEIGSWNGMTVVRTAVAGDLAVVGAGNSGRVLDLSNPASPAVLATLSFESTVRDIEIVGDLAFVVQANLGGVAIWDLSTPSSPLQIGEFAPFPLAAEDAVIDGDTMYVAGGAFFGVLEVDISDPSSPVQRGQFDTGGSAVGLALRGGEIFVADFDNGIYILGCDQGAIFLDDFESGGTGAWSLTSP